MKVYTVQDPQFCSAFNNPTEKGMHGEVVNTEGRHWYLLEGDARRKQL
jgi:hypothetical protein